MYPPLAGGGFNTGGLGDLRLLTTDRAPAATANVEYVLNLPANATPPARAPFDPDDPNTFNQATSLTLYDSLGATHTGTMYFDKTGERQRVERAAVHRRRRRRWRRRRCSTPTPALLTAPVGGLLPFPAVHAGHRRAPT